VHPRIPSTNGRAVTVALVSLVVTAGLGVGQPARAQSYKPETLENLKAGLEWTISGANEQPIAINIIDAKWKVQMRVKLYEGNVGDRLSDQVDFYNANGSAWVLFRSDDEGVLPPPPGGGVPNPPVADASYGRIMALPETGVLIQIDPPLPVIPNNPQDENNAIEIHLNSDPPPPEPGEGADSDYLKMTAIHCATCAATTTPSLARWGVIILVMSVLAAGSAVILRRRRGEAPAA